MEISRGQKASNLLVARTCGGASIGTFASHLNKLATSQSEIDLRGVLQHLRVECAGLFQRLVNIPLENRSPYTCPVSAEYSRV